MVELLVVVSIVGILLAAALSSFPGLFGKQGLVGSVRALSAKVSMAKSYAVTQNRHVALLLPDKALQPDSTPITSFTDTYLKPYIYCYTRLCYVDANNKFESWIEGEEWTQFANGTCAYIEAPNVQAAPLPPPPSPTSFSYTVQQITDIPPTPATTPVFTCSALVFQSNGTLQNAGDVVIRVNPALYNKETQVLTFNIKGGTIQQKRWNIVIAPFTGKVQYLYGKEQ